MKSPLLCLGALVLLAAACAAFPGLPTSTPAAPPAAVTSSPPAAAGPGGAVTQPPVAGETPAPRLALEEFSRRLAQAVEGQNFEELRSLMKARFSFATENIELLEVTSEEALERLRGAYLAEGSIPVARFDTDVPALLGGIDPLSLWGPVSDPVRAIHVTGLGPDASGEAVLVIARETESGQFYWHGLLVPAGVTFGNGGLPPEPGAVVDTAVQYVLAKDDLNVRTGPGTDYAVEGLIFSGQIAQVTGKSADGGWWRIICTQDSSGFCWISADPELSEPTAGP